MVYVKSKVMEAVRQALADNPSPDVKKMLEQERIEKDEAADKPTLQDSVFQYLLALQDDKAPYTIAELNSNLSWVGRHKSDIDPGALATITNIIRNIVGSAAHKMELRLRMQDFKRRTLGLYDDFDPIEAVISQALADLKSKDLTLVQKARQTLREVDSLIPAGGPG